MYDDETEENGPLLGNLIDIEESSQDNLNDAHAAPKSNTQVLSEEWQDPLLDVGSRPLHPTTGSTFDANPKDITTENRTAHAPDKTAGILLELDTLGEILE